MINYYLLTKPGIIFGNVVTFAAGFLLASKGNIDLQIFFATLIGLIFIIASAAVFNNYIDRHIDKKMKRTKNRSLATGSISKIHAITFATTLGAIGTLILLIYANLLTFLLTALGFFVYVILYSLWKRHTIYGTAIGSISGALPPVIGYCAVSNHLDIGALILFSMMVLWQMPHFFAIAITHLNDYIKADIPVLPVKKGMQRTKVQMLIYIFGFIFAAAFLTMFGYTGYLYLSTAIIFGLAWLGLCLKGFFSKNNSVWGRQMFRFSLILIMSICIVIPFDTL